MKARARKYSKLQFVSSLLGMSIQNKWIQAKELQQIIVKSRIPGISKLNFTLKIIYIYIYSKNTTIKRGSKDNIIKIIILN